MEVRRRGSGRVPMLAVGVAFALFAVLALLRWREGFANVDDYLYAAQTGRYLDAAGTSPRSMIDAWREYGSNSPLLPSLALPLAAIDRSPHWLVSIQVVPLAALLVAARSLLARLGVPRAKTWLGAAAITVLPPVAGYAGMYHFALAATACAVLAAAAYAASERLLHRRPALLLGVSVGLLSLTRVMALVYVAAIAVAVVIDVLLESRERAARIRNAFWAALVAGAIAAPWWAASGGIAWDYLVSAGYDEGLFTHEGSRLEIAIDRLEWTAGETGWLLSALLVALVALAAARAWRGGPARRLVAWLIGVCTLQLAFLATSSNEGTAFALPVVVLAACVAAAAIAGSRPWAEIALAATCSAVIAVGVLALVRVLPGASVGERPLWREGIPAWQQAEQALACDGCDLPDTDTLNADVLERIAGGPTLITRADAVLNPSGLRHVAATEGSAAQLTVPEVSGSLTAADLDAAHVITGSTAAPYLASPDPTGAEDTLRREGFDVAFTRRLSPANTIVVWSRPTSAAATGGDP